MSMRAPRPRAGEGRVNVTPDDRHRTHVLVARLGSIRAAREALGVSDTTMGCLLDGWRLSQSRLDQIRAKLTELGA